MFDLDAMSDAHHITQVLGQSQRECNDRQRGIRCARGREDGTAGDVEVGRGVYTPVAVDYPLLGVIGHSRCAHVVLVPLEHRRRFFAPELVFQTAHPSTS